MKLSHVRYFAAICKYGGMTRAAEEFHVTQPVLTKAIHALEQEFGVILFQRSGRRLELTAEGESFLLQAKELLFETDQALSGMRELGRRNKELRIATMSPIGAFAVSEPIWRYRGTRPDLTFKISETIKKSAREAVSHEAADLAILVTNRISREEFQVEPFTRSCVVYCMRPEHPLAGRDRVTFPEVVRYPMILEQNDSKNLPVIERQIRRRGLEAEVFLCTQQHGTAFRMLEGNLGYFVMEEIAAGQKGVCFAELAEPEAELEIGIVSKKNRKLSAEAKAFVRFIRKQYGESGKGIGE